MTQLPTPSCRPQENEWPIQAFFFGLSGLVADLARRIKQTSGDLLQLNYGTLYPPCSEWVPIDRL
jgi:hypothetical protein